MAIFAKFRNFLLKNYINKEILQNKIEVKANFNIYLKCYDVIHCVTIVVD